MYTVARSRRGGAQRRPARRARLGERLSRALSSRPVPRPPLPPPRGPMASSTLAQTGSAGAKSGRFSKAIEVPQSASVRSALPAGTGRSVLAGQARWASPVSTLIPNSSPISGLKFAWAFVLSASISCLVRAGLRQSSIARCSRSWASYGIPTLPLLLMSLCGTPQPRHVEPESYMVVASQS